MRISARAQRIEPFYVMEMAKSAAAIAREAAGSDRPMIYLNIGEPDFTAPPLVAEAAERAIRDGKTQYTQATGLPELRERISGWYRQRFGLDVPARRIVVTAGASAALQLACLALIEAGDEVLMPDPSYPCNRQFVSMAEGRSVLIPSTPAERFQLSADKVAAAWGPKTRGVLLASPSNPTGTSIAPDELRRIHEVVKARGGVTVIDEIYLGLSHDPRYGQTALALDDAIVSLNSFSKFFGMTGWRLGWAVVPEAMVPVMERLAQNYYICASTPAQLAALACFTPEAIAVCEARRAEFAARRALVLEGLAQAGLSVPVLPDGAFYVYIDVSTTGMDAMRFCQRALQEAHVALTPGHDFGPQAGATHVRLSYAASRDDLKEGMTRLSRFMQSLT